MDVWLNRKGTAQISMSFGVAPLVREHGADAGDDRESGQEQPLEGKRIVEVGCGGDAGERHPVPVCRDVVLGALLAAICWVAAGEIATALGAHRATTEDKIGVAAQ